MGIIVRFAHLAFDAADVTAQTPVRTADEPACVCEALVLEALLRVMLLSGRRPISFRPILAEDVPNLAIGGL
jgi:hypothetical protein